MENVYKPMDAEEMKLQMAEKVAKITERGNNAEVRREKNGGYKVYEVKKEIQ